MRSLQVSDKAYGTRHCLLGRPHIKWSDQLWDTLYNTLRDLWTSAIRRGQRGGVRDGPRQLHDSDNDDMEQSLAGNALLEEQ